MPKIFGREPALWLALVAAGVSLLSAFVVNVSTDQQAVINAVAVAVVGVITAVVARDGVSAAVLGLVQAAVALAVGFGLHLSGNEQAIAMSFAAAVVGMFVRTQVAAPVTAAALARSRHPKPIGA